MHEKPDVVKTHLRNMVIMPEMIGSMVGVYNGKTFTAVEIKVNLMIQWTSHMATDFLHLCLQAEMIGTYLAEYSMTYKPIKHGRPGIGATASSKFVPLK
jgi:small subunit ribosomal protein S15e